MAGTQATGSKDYSAIYGLLSSAVTGYFNKEAAKSGQAERYYDQTAAGTAHYVGPQYGLPQPSVGMPLMLAAGAAVVVAVLLLK